jgi:hypothetical protein
MNKTLLSRAKFAAVLVACTLAGLSGPRAQADGVNRPFDWLVNIQTQQLSRQFEYQGSTLKPVVKTSMNYFEDSDPNKSTDYEYIWYHDAKPLGVEKLNKFALRSGDAIAINVQHKNLPATPAEPKAAANAIIHVVLDAYLNRNSVALVKVPFDSFDAIVSELQAEHFELQNDNGADSPNPTGVNIFVASDPPGKSNSFTYF